MFDVKAFGESFQYTASFWIAAKKWGDTAVAVSPRFITGW
jgi:hypothetical protein